MSKTSSAGIESLKKHPSTCGYMPNGVACTTASNLRLPTARQWLLQSLAISQKDGYSAGAAVTYGELASIAREQRDLQAAKTLYLEALAIQEKQGDRHAAAFTYANLGALADDQGNLMDAGRWVARSI